jgi:hypothetical protein
MSTAVVDIFGSSDIKTFEFPRAEFDCFNVDGPSTQDCESPLYSSMKLQAAFSKSKMLKAFQVAG